LPALKSAFGRLEPTFYLFADETPTHVPPNDNEHHADVVGADGDPGSRGFFVSNHVDQQ
jgi:hypothetical protein